MLYVNIHKPKSTKLQFQAKIGKLSNESNVVKVLLFCSVTHPPRTTTLTTTGQPWRRQSLNRNRRRMLRTIPNPIYTPKLLWSLSSQPAFPALSPLCNLMWDCTQLLKQQWLPVIRRIYFRSTGSITDQITTDKKYHIEKKAELNLVIGIIYIYNYLAVNVLKGIETERNQQKFDLREEKMRGKKEGEKTKRVI